MRPLRRPAGDRTDTMMRWKRIIVLMGEMKLHLKKQVS